MNTSRRRARINIKALVILALIVFLLGAGAVVGHYVRKRMVADEALAAGKAAVAAEDWPEACKQLRRYLSKYPDDVEVLESYSAAHLAVRPRKFANIGGAIGAFRRLLRHKPGDAYISQELAKLHFSVRSYNEAAYVCRQRLATDENDPDAMFCLGRALAAQQKRDEAMSILTRLVESHSDWVTGHALLSALAVQEGSVSGVAAGLRWLDQAVDANPESVGALANRARFHRVLSRDLTAARKDLEALDALETDDPRELLVVAVEWIEWQEYERAALYLDRVDQIDADVLAGYDIDPDHLKFVRLKTEADLALKASDVEQRGAVADRALASLSDPQRGRFLLTAVKLYLGADRVDDAERYLDEYAASRSEASSRAEPDEEYLVLAAELAGVKDSHYEAINLLVAQRDRFRKNPKALEVLADGFYATGQPGRARATLQQYVELAPRDWEALLRLARAFRYIDWERAYTNATAAWRIRPTLGAKLLVLESRLMRAGGRTTESELVRKVLSELTDLRTKYPQSVGVAVLTAAVVSQHRRIDEAIALLETAIPACEEPLAAELMLVDLYARTDRESEAQTLCEQTVRRRDNLAAPRRRLAELHISAEQNDLARAVYERAVAELTGDERRATVVAFVRFLLTEREPQTAVDLLRGLAADRPGDVEVRLTLLGIP